MSTDRPVILVVDDKRNMLRLMAKVLGGDARILTAACGVDAVAQLKHEDVDVVLSDLKMPDMDGLEVLRASQRLRPRAEFILMTAYASVGTAVEALRLGAYDYLTKPFDPADARSVVLRALGRARRLEGQDEELGEVLPGLLGRSPAMHELGELVRRVAGSAATALVVGETGTGKERIARAIHGLSARAAHRFVAVNCAAIPTELVESELFGYARGAFTGAARDRRGLFEEAHEGTLFLDEIGELRLSLQAKLTRALEERAIRRIGDTAERAVDVRFVAATHRDLGAQTATGAFREDLWYRLNVAVVRVPPLRERPEDIEPLALHFLRELGGTLQDRQVLGFAPAAMAALEGYGWPGNVRQLRSAVERACVVTPEERIDVGDLPPEVAGAEPMAAGGSGWAELTWAQAQERGRTEAARAYLLALLRRFDGRVAAAAEQAGVERESFYRLLRRFGVDATRFRSEP